MNKRVVKEKWKMVCGEVRVWWCELMFCGGE